MINKPYRYTGLRCNTIHPSLCARTTLLLVPLFSCTPYVFRSGNKVTIMLLTATEYLSSVQATRALCSKICSYDIDHIYRQHMGLSRKNVIFCCNSLYGSWWCQLVVRVIQVTLIAFDIGSKSYVLNNACEIDLS